MKRMPEGLRIDKVIHGFIDRYLYEVSFFFLLALSVAIRIHFSLYNISGDYEKFLEPWLEQYSSYSVLEALGHNITNYYEPYNWILDIIAHLPIPCGISLAFVSCLGEYTGTYFIYKCLLLLDTPENSIVSRTRARFSAAAILFIPFAMMNGALWKQCDAIYSCFAIISIYFMLRKHYTKSFFFFALSFAFKLQAIFLLPFYIILYICSSEFSIIQFFQVPVMYLFSGIPALLMKRGVKNTYLTYLGQTKDPTASMVNNSSSLYNLGMNDLKMMKTPALMITVAVLTVTTVFIYRKKNKMNCFGRMYLAGWSILSCYFFLPEMHERYDYLALIILTGLILYKRKKMLAPLLVMLTCTTIHYGMYLHMLNDVSSDLTFQVILSAAYCVAYFVLTVDLHRWFSE